MTKKTPSHTARGRGRLVLITVLVVLAVLLSAAAAGVVLAGRYDKVYPNVSLGGVALGGMTVDEAAQTLRDAGFGEVPEGSVTAELPAGVELTLSADEVCTTRSRTRPSPMTTSASSSARTSPTSSRASRSSPASTTRAARTSRWRTCARCSWR